MPRRHSHKWVFHRVSFSMSKRGMPQVFVHWVCAIDHAHDQEKRVLARKPGLHSKTDRERVLSGMTVSLMERAGGLYEPL